MPAAVVAEAVEVVAPHTPAVAVEAVAVGEAADPTSSQSR